MSNTLTKAALVKAIADLCPRSTKADIEAVLTSLAEVTRAAVEQGQTVTLLNIVKLTPKAQAERQSRNPATGEAITVPAKTVVKAKPIGRMAEAL